MIPLLIYLLLKKSKKISYQKIMTIRLVRRNRLILIIMVLSLLVSCILFSQSRLLNYKIIRNGNESGWVKLNKNVNGKTSIISMASEIKIKMIILFTVISNEYVESKDTQLIHCYVFRKVNGSIKADVHTRFTGNTYEKESASGKEKLNFQPAGFTVLDLYFQEPSGVAKAYSASHQQNLSIKRQKAGVYKLYLPNGDTNEYYYENGLCVKVKIDHSLYSVEFVLTLP